MAEAYTHHRSPRIAGCPSHAAQVYEKRRAAVGELALAVKIRNSSRWAKTSRLLLSENPLCADPYRVHDLASETVLATSADHVVGLALRPDLAFERENLQPLCSWCHAKKSASERAAAGKHAR